MKKTLIATTALVAAGMLASPASAAEKIKLGVSGFMENWVGFATQQSAFETGAGTAFESNYNDIDVQQDSELTFSGSSKLDNGITVKAVLEIEADRGATGRDSVAVYLSSPSMGTVLIGADKTPTWGMKKEAPDVGIDRTDSDNWIVNPGSNSAQERPYVDGLSDAHKIGYKSPSFGGLQIGASYAPDSATTQTGMTNMNTGAGSEYDVGVAYNGKFGGTSVGAALIWHGEETQANNGDRDIITGGLSVSMSGITVGGAYTQISDDDGSVAGRTSTDGDFYNVGVSYKAGPTSVSLSYAHGEAEGLTSTAADDERSVIMLSAGYNMGPGIDMKASLFQAEYIDEAKTAALKNKGWGIVAGVDLAF